MGLDAFVNSAKKFQAAPKRSAPQHAVSQSLIIVADEFKASAPNLAAPGSWNQCKHLLRNPSKNLCKQFGCRCKEDACPPKFRL